MSITWPIEKASQITNGTLTELLNKIKTEFKKRDDTTSGEHLTTLLSWLPDSISDGQGKKITAADANSVLKAIEALSLSYLGENVLESDKDIPEAIKKLSYIQVDIVNDAYNTITNMENSWNDDKIKYAGCQGACQGACLQTCFNKCQETCITECSGDCGTDCGGQCSQSCSGCGNNCYDACRKTCSNVCSAECKASCAGGCFSSCTSVNSANSGGLWPLECGGNCVGVCSGMCSGCEGTCKNSCETKCKDNCTGICYNSCGAGCMTICSASCSASCKADCKNDCNTYCMETCSGGCKASCTGVAGFTITSE